MQQAKMSAVVAATPVISEDARKVRDVLIERGLETPLIENGLNREFVVSASAAILRDSGKKIYKIDWSTLLNTSRGAVVDTQAAIAALKVGTLGSLGLDVYEEEGGLFFRDLSGAGIQDDVFARLLTFPNVVVTGHQGFFTEDALAAIASTTLANLNAFAATGKPLYPVSV